MRARAYKYVAKTLTKGKDNGIMNIVRQSVKADLSGKRKEKKLLKSGFTIRGNSFWSKCMYRYFFKRVLDIVLSFLGIVLLGLPMLLIAIIVRIDTKASAIFKTHRVGKNCKSFKFYKFRSMSKDAPEDCAPYLLQKDYTTKFGRFLRKTSLDELPQLFCIFTGKMSIVGPRPAGLSEHELIAEREKYGANGVLPGLTGLAQVNGRDVLAACPAEKARVDGEYVQKITFWRDLKICFKTVFKVFKHTDIVEGKAALEVERHAVETSVAATEIRKEEAENAKAKGALQDAVDTKEQAAVEVDKNAG